MLKTPLTHPEILAAIGRAGHGARVLIADGNYPAGTTLGPNAEMVHLNLTPGQVSCTDVLAALVSTMPIEAAHVMDYARTGPYALAEEPPIWAEFRSLLEPTDTNGALQTYERFEFYDEVALPNVCLTIATGDQRIYANLLLTIGVVKPG